MGKGSGGERGALVTQVQAAAVKGRCLKEGSVNGRLGIKREKVGEVKYGTTGLTLIVKGA